jgi:hypothetical protein
MLSRDSEVLRLSLLAKYLAYVPKIDIIYIIGISKGRVVGLTNSMAYGTRRFNAAFTRAL